MISKENDNIVKFSVVIPCFNEEKTLKKCAEKVLEIADESLWGSGTLTALQFRHYIKGEKRDLDNNYKIPHAKAQRR